MEQSRLRHTIRHLVYAMAVVSVPAEATTALHTGKVNALVNEVTYRLIDFLTPEMALLGGLVLLALVFVARRTEVH